MTLQTSLPARLAAPGYLENGDQDLMAMVSVSSVYLIRSYSCPTAVTVIVSSQHPNLFRVDFCSSCKFSHPRCLMKSGREDQRHLCIEAVVYLIKTAAC